MDLSKIKTALQSLLVDFGSVKTVDGTEISYEGEALEVGVKVNNTEDGEYTLEDESVIVVKDGLVESITPKAEEVKEEVEEKKEDEVEAEEVEEVKEEVEEVKEGEDKTAELESKIAELTERLTVLEEKMKELLETPAVEPIAEEFQKVDTKKDKGSKTANILSYIHN